MEYKEIESLKLALLNLTRQRCRLNIPSMGINGMLVGVGFKPYWTKPYDSKIEKLEINYMDSNGKVVPVVLSNVISYDVVSNDGRGYDTMKNACLDIHIYSTGKPRGKDPIEKVRVDISAEE